MYLLKLLNILKANSLRFFSKYQKKFKKSIWFTERIDFFILVSALILIITPVFIGIFSGRSSDGNRSDKIELFLSPESLELFGREFTETMLLEFSREFPDLRITVLNNPPEKDKEPDIFIFAQGQFNKLSSAGALFPLVSFMDLLFYNIELLSIAGFDRPPKTRDEFLLYAKTVSRGNNAAQAGASGMAIGLSPRDNLAVSRDIFSWIWASGNDFWSAEDTPVINTRFIIRDITFLGSLFRENALARESFEATGDQRLEEFARGEIAMMITSTHAIPALREKMGDSAFGVTTIPDSGIGGKYNIGISSIYAGINNNTVFPEEAWIFLSFLIRQIPLLCAELKAVPGSADDLFFGDYMINDPFYSKARDIFESANIVRGFSGIPGGEDYENIVREEMQIFFETGRTAQQTVYAIQQRWDTVQ